MTLWGARRSERCMSTSKAHAFLHNQASTFARAVAFAAAVLFAAVLIVVHG